MILPQFYVDDVIKRAISEDINYIDVAKRRLFLAWNELDRKNKRHIYQNNLIDEFEKR